LGIVIYLVIGGHLYFFNSFFMSFRELPVLQFPVLLEIFHLVPPLLQSPVSQLGRDIQQDRKVRFIGIFVDLAHPIDINPLSLIGYRGIHIPVGDDDLPSIECRTHDPLQMLYPVGCEKQCKGFVIQKRVLQMFPDKLSKRSLRRFRCEDDLLPKSLQMFEKQSRLGALPAPINTFDDDKRCHRCSIDEMI